LETENDLAENEEHADFVFAEDADNEDGGKNSDAAGYESAEPGLEADLEEPFHDDLAGKSAGKSGILAGGEEGAGEERAGKTCAESGRQQVVGFADVCNVVEAPSVKSGGAKQENGGIDEECKTESEGGIEDGIAKGFAALLRFGAEGARLHKTGVEVEIVRHDRGAEDADGDVEHFAITEDLGVGKKNVGGLKPERTREKDLVGEAGGDGEDERDDEGFQHAKAAALEQEDDKNVEGGENNAEKERNVKQELERNGGTEDLGEIAGCDGNLADEPEENRGATRISLAARLGKVAAGNNAEFGGQGL